MVLEWRRVLLALRMRFVNKMWSSFATGISDHHESARVKCLLALVYDGHQILLFIVNIFVLEVLLLTSNF